MEYNRMNTYILVTMYYKIIMGYYEHIIKLLNWKL